MDFFAQAYNRSESPLPQEPQLPHEGTCQGYGSESNAHLRRASSGLEMDVPRHFPQIPVRFVAHLLHHHHGQGGPVTHDMKAASPIAAPTTTTTAPAVTSGVLPNLKDHDFSYFSVGRLTGGQEIHPHRTENNVEANTPPLGSPLSTPALNRRASVSNPCLLNHVNSNGMGVVRPPAMPQSVSYSMNEGDPLSPTFISPRQGYDPMFSESRTTAL